jgi:hypothetical protein
MLAIKMAKPWPVLASEFNRQLGAGAKWKGVSILSLQVGKS